MRAVTLLVVTVLVLGVVCGCTSSNDTAVVGRATQDHAECSVCKHNADLACIEIAVTDSTPQTSYQDRTYFFCSRSCKAEFEKEPAKFVER
jgi:YHS domain-containing protein